jgi:hypothetical protein
VTARARESRGSAAFSKDQGSLSSLLGMNLEWRGIGGQVPVVPTHSFRAIADPRRRLFRIHSGKWLMALPFVANVAARGKGYIACLRTR